ncbi:MAG: hypothetical protein WC955_06555 [Elusimicrobiota bacterium]
MKEIVVTVFTIFFFTIEPVYSIIFENNYSARAAGVAGSFSSLADTVDAVFWNPAGLSYVNTQEFTFMYGKPYTGFTDIDIGYNYFGYARHMGLMKTTVCFAWASLTNSDIYTQEIYAVSAGYKFNTTTPLALGLTMKYLGYRINTEYLSSSEIANSKYANALDLGLTYQPVPLCTTALVVRNFNEPDLGIASADVLPMEIRCGINFAINNSTLFETIKPVFEVIYSQNHIDFALGTEIFVFKNSIAFRIGYNPAETTLGAGFYKKIGSVMLKIDYAYSIPSQIESSGGSHRISSGIKL